MTQGARIPNLDAGFVDWLEGCLSAQDLSEVVGALRSSNRTSPDTDQLNSSNGQSAMALLGDGYAEVLERGFQTLSPEKLCTLREAILRQPEFLYELHETVCLHGGAYWDARLYVPIERLPSAYREAVTTAALQINSRIATRSAHVVDGTTNSRVARRHRIAYAAALAFLLIAATFGIYVLHRAQIETMRAAFETELAGLTQRLDDSNVATNQLRTDRDALAIRASELKDDLNLANARHKAELHTERVNSGERERVLKNQMQGKETVIAQLRKAADLAKTDNQKRETESKAVIAALNMQIESYKTKFASLAVPDQTLTPTSGSVELKVGFRPNPYTNAVGAGGTLNTYLGGVNAWVNKAPDFRLRYKAGQKSLLISAEPYGDEKAELSLLINLPDSKWIAGKLPGVDKRGAEIRFDRPQSGIYDIWVGTTTRVSNGAAKLVITEREQR